MAKEAERIEILAALARNYLYMYGGLQSMIVNASDLTKKQRVRLLDENLEFLAQQEAFIAEIERGNHA